MKKTARQRKIITPKSVCIMILFIRRTENNKRRVLSNLLCMYILGKLGKDVFVRCISAIHAGKEVFQAVYADNLNKPTAVNQ